MESAAAASQSKDPRPVRRRARCALCNPHTEPNTEMTKDNTINPGLNEVELPEDNSGNAAIIGRIGTGTTRTPLRGLNTIVSNCRASGSFESSLPWHARDP